MALPAGYSTSEQTLRSTSAYRCPGTLCGPVNQPALPKQTLLLGLAARPGAGFPPGGRTATHLCSRSRDSRPCAGQPRRRFRRWVCRATSGGYRPSSRCVHLATWCKGGPGLHPRPFRGLRWVAGDLWPLGRSLPNSCPRLAVPRPWDLGHAQLNTLLYGGLCTRLLSVVLPSGPAA